MNKATFRNERGLLGFGVSARFPARLSSSRARAPAPHGLLRCCLVLIGWDEDLVDEIFVGRRSRVLGCARLERAHVSRVQAGGHFEKQSGELVGHPCLNQRRSHLFVGQLPVLEIRLGDGLADNRGDLGVGDIALALQLLGLLAVERQIQKSIRGKGSDVAGCDQGKFEVRANWATDKAHLRNDRDLRQRVFHEVTGAQKEYVGVRAG